MASRKRKVIYLCGWHSQLALYFYWTVLPWMRPFLLESAGPVHTFATVPVSILPNVTVTPAGQDLNPSGRSYKHLPTLCGAPNPHPAAHHQLESSRSYSGPAPCDKVGERLLPPCVFLSTGPTAKKAVCTLVSQRALKAFSFFISAISAGKRGGVPGSDFYFVLFSIQYFLFVLFYFLPLKSAYGGIIFTQ